MRLSISCDHCRLSKVKCIHDGHPPCRRCLRLNRGNCLLTDPRSPSTRPARTPRTPRTPRQAPTRPNSPPLTITSQSPLSTLSPATLIAACDLYRRKFPVVNFLHYPSLIADLSRDATAVEPVFLAALLSLCARFMTDRELAPSETYAEYARTQLAHRAFESPSLPLAQSLVMISLYEWGSGRPYRAWMYSGMATYMIQSLLKTADDHMEQSPDEFHAQSHAQIAYEQLVRTYWCCFAQDCELSSGARQHFALSFRQISVPLPIGDSDFNFGRATRRLTPAEMNRGVVIRNEAGGLGIEHGLAIVTRGFDIFVRILRFANESRRERARGVAPSSSLATWQALKGELDEWRALQDITVRYPETNAPVHVALGYGELFAYINLVYLMSILFLYRDRFLTGPRTQTDPHDEPIDRLFSTAQHIGAILSSLESCATPVITPYAGFSVFVAAHINMYGTVCPARYPGGLGRAEREKKANLEYLERLCRFWDVGTSWWRTLQEANRFYETARSTQQGLESDREPLALAGTFDEYGDIRIARPEASAARGHDTPVTPRACHTMTIRGSSVAAVEPDGAGPAPATGTGTGTGTVPASYDFEVEMMQWPFLDEGWSVGFATGYETTWPA